MVFPNKAAPNGTELMLKSMGLGEVIEAAKMFASKGTMQKIMSFADHSETLAETVKSIDARLERIEKLLVNAEKVTIHADQPAAGYGPSEPRPDTEHGSDGRLSDGPGRSSLGEYRAA